MEAAEERMVELARRAGKIAEMPESKYESFLEFLSEMGENTIHSFAVDVRTKREG